MIMIFAVDQSWDIGFRGEMLVAIDDDLKRFRQITEGNIVIMGRKTLEAIPSRQPLVNRDNILVTRGNCYENQGFYILNDMKDLDELLEELNPNGEKEVFVTGGQVIVEQLFHRCNKAYITKIFKDFPNADTRLPDLDEDEDWEIVEESEIFYQEDLAYQYIDYVRKSNFHKD